MPSARMGPGLIGPPPLAMPIEQVQQSEQWAQQPYAALEALRAEQRLQAAPAI
jgi:hypothetical protein